MTSDVYQLFAIRYATNPGRRRVENFLYHAPGESDAAMALDFFVWIAIGQRYTVLIDTGADAATCASRNTRHLCCPADTLSAIGVNPSDIRNIVTTHLHWDHAGNFDKFPNARFHVQAAELAHATNGCMSDPFLRRIHDVDQVCNFIRLLYSGRLNVHDGDAEICPGIVVRRVGGHTPGTQIVDIMTRRGRVLLASDAMHYYENGRARNPFPGLTSVPESMAALSLLDRLAESPDHIVPGHDPLVLSRYPSAIDQESRVVRLDVMPQTI